MHRYAVRNDEAENCLHVYYTPTKMQTTRVKVTHTSACEVADFVDLQWDDKMLDTACSRLHSRNTTVPQISDYINRN